MSATLIQQTSTIFCTHLRSMLCPAQPLFKLSCSQSTAFASSLSCERLHWQYTNPALRDLPRLDRRGSRRTCSQRTRSPRSSRRATRRTCRVVAKLLANFRQHVARFRQYRHRFLQVNMRSAAFFKIYQIINLNFFKFDKILQILRPLQFFGWNFTKITAFSNRVFAKILRLQRCKRMQIL